MAADPAMARIAARLGIEELADFNGARRQRDSSNGYGASPLIGSSR